MRPPLIHFAIKSMSPAQGRQPYSPPAEEAGTTTFFWAGIAATLLVIGTYNLVFFNKYFPLTEGWFSAYAHLIIKGKIPYRDFYLFLPPLYPIQLAAFTRVFGDTFIALRIMGVGLILSMTVVLYLLYSRWFTYATASFATIVSIIYYQSGVAHIPYDFTQFVTAYALFATLFIVKFSENLTQNSTRGLKFAFLGGIFASLAFLTKQSNGAFILLFSGIAIILGGMNRGSRITAKSAAAYLAGAAVPLAVTTGWLVYKEALPDFINQVYFGAVQSKGSLDNIFFAWAIGLFTSSYYLKQFAIILACSAFLLAINIYISSRKSLSYSAPRFSGRVQLFDLALITCFGLLAVLWPLYSPAAINTVISHIGEQFWKYAIAVSLLTSFGVFTVGSIQFALKHPAYVPGPFLLATIALGMIMGNGTSAGISEISCFIGLGFFLGIFLSLKSDFFIGEVVSIVLGLSLIVFLASKKYAAPYDWWLISQPAIQTELVQTGIPQLAGFRLSKETGKVLKEVGEIISDNTSKADSILAFPHIPIFYLLSDRWPSSRAVVYWFDFLPDDKAKLEAALLLQDPPAAIVYMDLPEYVWETHERLFRKGKPLGQREVKKAIEQLTAQPGRYGLAKQYQLQNGCTLKVWIRSKLPS